MKYKCDNCGVEIKFVEVLPKKVYEKYRKYVKEKYKVFCPICTSESFKPVPDDQHSMPGIKFNQSGMSREQLVSIHALARSATVFRNKAR